VSKEPTPEHIEVSRSPWMSSYYHAKRRCSDPKDKRYKHYGGRGISFLLSREDMECLWLRDEAAKMKDPTIDRKDSALDYFYENCRFIERVENSRRVNGELTKCRRGHSSFVVRPSGKRVCSECQRSYYAEYNRFPRGKK